MKNKCVAIVLFLFSSCFLGNVNPAIVKSVMQSESSAIEKGCAQAKKFRYVFVTGFLNEVMSRYFSDHTQWLRGCGVENTDIKTITPQSTRSISQNEVLLFDRIKNFGDLANKKIVIIAHSKGAFELFLGAVNHSEWVAQKVAGLFFLQGAFLGSPVADFVVGKGDGLFLPLDFMIRSSLQLLNGAFREVESVLGASISAGLDCLTSKGAMRIWQRVNGSKIQKYFKENFNKNFSLVAVSSTSSVNPIIYPSSWYLDWVYGADSDGLVTRASQNALSHWWGIPKMDIAMDHFDGVLNETYSGRSKQFRQKMMAAFIQATTLE